MLVICLVQAQVHYDAMISAACIVTFMSRCFDISMDFDGYTGIVERMMRCTDFLFLNFDGVADIHCLCAVVTAAVHIT